MSIRIESLGAAGEVTGSKHLVSVDDQRILVDCGAFQGKRAEADEKNRALLGGVDPASLTSVVLTHAHYDHCGLLPLLVKRGYSGSIFCTPATRDLANLVMADSARIQERDAAYLSAQAEKKSAKFDWKPLYDEMDVVKTMSLFVTMSYHRKIAVAEGVEIEFLDAGHILGSALVKMTIVDKSGERVVLGFSGDLGRRNKPIINDPEFLTDIDYLVLESTYGDRLHDEMSDAVERLASIVAETAKKRGKVIIPAFAVERTQELIFHLHLLLDNKKIPDIPIWVDSPMAVDATSIFQIHPECYDQETYDAFLKHHENPFGFGDLHFSRTVEESKKLNDIEGSAIIISADGMCEFGRIQHHLMHTLEHPENSILIVGYMAEGTLGRRLKDGAKEVRIHGEFFKVNAKVEEIAAFSAHADYAETLDWLTHTNSARLKRIYLVHGEAAALESLHGKVLKAGFADSTIVRKSEVYEL